MTPVRQTDFPSSAQTRSSLGAELLGRKRGIFVLAADAIAKEHSVMNTLNTARSAICPMPPLE